VSRGVAMKITGHKTEEIFERYNITSTEDLREAGTSLTEYLNTKRQAVAKPVPKLRAVI